MPNTTQLMSASELILKSINSTLNTFNDSAKQSNKTGELTEGDVTAITTFPILVPFILWVSVLFCYLAKKCNKKTISQKQMKYSVFSNDNISYNASHNELQDIETPTIQEIDNTSFNENKTTISTINENQSLNGICGLESNKTNENLLQNTNTENKKEHQHEEIALHEDPMQITECSAEVLAEQEESIAI